jgi:polyisoprenoid-binding protein YceI
MKTSFLRIFAFTALIVLTNCKDTAKEAVTEEAKEAAVAEETAVSYRANPDKSSIAWKGFKPTGSHNGTINIAKGEVRVADGAIESGNFAIDMKSIVVLDIPMDNEKNADLTGHLKSADFFDVEAYPNAMFEVTGMSTENGQTMLSGNLTMKDATNNISFPVTTSIDGNTMTLTSETFSIDRSKWNVKYGSKSFFDNLGDKFINDDIELKVTLVADMI